MTRHRQEIRRETHHQDEADMNNDQSVPANSTKASSRPVKTRRNIDANDPAPVGFAAPAGGR